jgi:acyl-coenzyme A thioesterase PaaI-like protein
VTREPAFQDYYPEHLAHCYGCGRLNAQGYRLETRWDGEESVTYFTPAPYHTAVPGVVYGGLLASIVDCHSTGTAAAALYRAQGRAMDSEPAHRCVTGSLNVRYLHPTPLGPAIEVRGRVTAIDGRKVTVVSRVLVGDVVTVEAEAVAIEIRDGFGIPVLRPS